MSTVKGIVVSSGLVRIIVGLPYSPVIVDAMPIVCMIALEASALIVESVVPKLYRSPDGGGIRKARKAIGNMSWRKVQVKKC